MPRPRQNNREAGEQMHGRLGDPTPERSELLPVDDLEDERRNQTQPFINVGSVGFSSSSETIAAMRNAAAALISASTNNRIRP